MIWRAYGAVMAQKTVAEGRFAPNRAKTARRADDLAQDMAHHPTPKP